MADRFDTDRLDTGRQDTDVLPGQMHPAATRSLDPVALIAGLVFSLLAVLVLAGVHVSWVFGHGGLVWLVLIGAGVALLVSELRRARRRR